MTMTPLVAPPEAQPTATPASSSATKTERLSRPFRLGCAGIGAALGLFARLAAANGYGDLDSRPTMLIAAATSALVGLGLLLIAAERDRFSPPLAWISAVAALAWGALNWISPPFAESVTVWSQPDQAILSILGVGNGLLLAGLISLAFVRRSPTFSVAVTMIAGVCTLAADTIALRNEWAAIVLVGAAFALILLAWDRSPRHERSFTIPDESPRVSRAALSLLSVALCGTAIQGWLSRMASSRSLPAVAICALLISAAFASLLRVRREIEQRETSLSEWTSWMREIPTNDFRAEMENFESTPSSGPRSIISSPAPDAQSPRKLSFPDLIVPDALVDDDNPLLTFDRDIASICAAELAEAASELSGSTVHEAPPGLTPAKIPASGLVADARPASTLGLVADSAPGKTTEHAPPSELPPRGLEPEVSPSLTAAQATVAAATPDAAEATPPPTAPGGAFSTMLTNAADADQQPVVAFGLDTLGAWLASPEAGARIQPLLVAVEALSLDEFESLPPDDVAMATQEIGSFLADTIPDADLVSWIDGPYFIIAIASKPDNELAALNKAIRKSLKVTAGALALLRPGTDAVLDDLVDQAVMGLLTARRLEDRAAGR